MHSHYKKFNFEEHYHPSKKLSRKVEAAPSTEELRPQLAQCVEVCKVTCRVLHVDVFSDL